MTLKPEITYDDFARLDLRIATILSATPHPDADRLLVLQVDLGFEQRQICAGIREHVQDPQTLVGRQLVMVANLAPRKIRGEWSNGMLMAASDEPSGRVVLLQPAAEVAPGSAIN